MAPKSLADRIDALLPQTQCGRCKFEACRPYAEALASGVADINRCPPGGQTSIEALARLLGVAPKALDPECGQEHPQTRVVIDEAWCIGCVKCVQVCPVDAIVGAAGQMHTVLAEECTGCDRCIAPCPMDCIQVVPAQSSSAPPEPNEVPKTGAFVPAHWPGGWTQARAERARRRYRARQARLDRQQRLRAKRRKRQLEMLAGRTEGADAEASRKAAIEAAIARAQARRAQVRR